MTINEFLVQKLPASGKTVIGLIQSKKVLINGVPASQQQPVTNRDQIIFEEKILQQPYDYFYLLYYKPRGIECTMNREIPQNLADALPQYKDFFPVGRLDKESEGLLLLTNDGILYKEIAPSEALKEKEYIVEVDKLLTGEALQALSEGVMIMGKKTRPAKIEKISEACFRIVLTQGLNRQIRRMCYKLGYEVISLKRIRIMSLMLGALEPGNFRVIERDEILF